MSVIVSGDGAGKTSVPSGQDGIAWAVPDLETGGPILKMIVEDGVMKEVTPVAYLRPDPGYRICRAVVTR